MPRPLSLLALALLPLASCTTTNTTACDCPDDAHAVNTLPLPEVGRVVQFTFAPDGLGAFGRVTSIEGDLVRLRTADGGELVVLWSSVTSVRSGGELDALFDEIEEGGGLGAYRRGTNRMIEVTAEPLPGASAGDEDGRIDFSTIGED